MKRGREDQGLCGGSTAEPATRAGRHRHHRSLSAISHAGTLTRKLPTNRLCPRSLCLENRPEFG